MCCSTEGLVRLLQALSRANAKTFDFGFFSFSVCTAENVADAFFKSKIVQKLVFTRCEAARSWDGVGSCCFG